MPKSFRLTNRTTLITSTAQRTYHLLALMSLLSAVACGAETNAEAGGSDGGASVSPQNGARSDAGVSPSFIPNPESSDEPIVGSDAQTEPSDEADASTPAGSAPTSGSTTTTPSNPDEPVESTLCGSVACACNDGLDNDGDGVTDGMDQECTGPYDNEEETFATGIPGDNQDPKWQDCFFDGNSGAGDDDCRYHTDCLTGEEPADSPDCSLTDACIEFCQPLTPPGCDCFGCCEVPHEGETIGIMMSDTCSLANLDDEDACPRCVPSDNCENECGECELCLGKTLADLPDSCWDNDTPPDSDGGIPPGEPGSDGGVPDTTDPDTTDPDTTDPDTTDPDTTDPDTTDDPQTPPPNTCDIGTPCASNADCQAGDYCRLGCCVDYTPQVL